MDISPAEWKDPISGPFLVACGPVSFCFDGKAGHVQLELEERHMNSFGIGHGGALMTLLDGLMGQTLMATYGGGKPAATLSLHCDFLRQAARGDRVRGRGEITLASREIFALRGHLRVGDTLIATAAAIWKPVRDTARKSAPSPILGKDDVLAGARSVSDREPFEQLAGPFYRLAGAGEPAYAARIEPRHANLKGSAHGGALMTFADAVMGDRVLTDIKGAPFVTLSQTTDFLRPVPVGALVTCRPVLVTRHDDTAMTIGSFEVAGEEVLRVRSLWKVLPS